MTMQIQLPRLKPTVEILDPDGSTLHLRYASRDFTLDEPPGWAAPFLFALDGRRRLPQIAQALRNDGAEATLKELAETLVQLCELGLIEDAIHDRLLTAYERDRYDRQLRYFAEVVDPGLSAAAHQLRLRDARVVVLGLGALGGHVAEALVAAGVGGIVAVDGDTVELSNLNRQTLYSEADVGRVKVEVAAERLGALNSQTRVQAERLWLTAAGDIEGAVKGADFVIDAVDSPRHQIEGWVNDACFKLGVPYVGMSHYPPWIRIGPTYIPGETGCYRCQEVEWRRQDPLFDIVPDHSLPPATGPTAAAVGGLVAMEVIHYLTGISPPASLATAVLIDVRALSVERRHVIKRANCAICGPGRELACGSALLPLQN